MSEATKLAGEGMLRLFSRLSMERATKYTTTTRGHDEENLHVRELWGGLHRDDEG
jgi:hypothetical protein